MVDPPGNGGQRRQVPCGCVVPNREQRLQIGRGRNVIGLYHAITPQTPSKLVVVCKYSPPIFRSCRPSEVVRSSRTDCVSCRMFSGLAPIVYPRNMTTTEPPCSTG